MRRSRARSETGQAAVLLTGVMMLVVVGAVVLGAIAGGVAAHGRHQSAADLAALSGARAMHTAFPRLFEPASIDGRANPRHLERAAYLALGAAAARDTAGRNGAHAIRVAFPDGKEFAPVRIRVEVRDPALVTTGGVRREADMRSVAEAELAPPGTGGALASGGGYSGPLAYRQGKPMRPDVALAFDRMEAAARSAGIALTITSAYRSDAEQAVLFARHPDPKWVAPPGRSLHRLGTELDLGPSSAYGWLLANSQRFGFLRRYTWEPWHFGYTRSPGSRSVGFGPSRADGRSALPSFVPARFSAPISLAAQRWGVSAALLAAQLYAESGFNPFAQSGAGAQGIAQFMPGTAHSYGLTDPFDAPSAINAQAHLMHDLLSQFGSVPLALAAYNAGPAPVARCGCVPAIPETQGYVARILGLLGGAGEVVAGGGLVVRLVE
jgi:hypothetical protein